MSDNWKAKGNGMEELTNSKICRREFVLGIPTDCCSVDYILQEMNKNIEGKREKKYISITNTESMYYAQRIPSHLQYIRNAAFSLCDGIGIVIISKFARKRIWRLNGPILMLRCCEYGASRGWRHFFYGGEEGVAELLSQKLTEMYPNMITSGVFCPPFGPMTEQGRKAIVEHINTAKPDILWVGLGLLKQERWISEYINKVNVPWLIGVGAAFNYHAGIIPWAPSCIRWIGLEWLYRLFFEPRRLFIRNIRSFTFMFEAIFESLFANNRLETKCSQTGTSPCRPDE